MNSKRMIITGAAGHLGRELWKNFAGEGWKLTLIDRDTAELEKAAADVGDQGDFNLVTADLEVEESYTSSVLQACEDGLDVLINNAAFVGTSGLEGWADDFENQSTAAWRSALEVNLIAPFRLSQICTPALRDARDGNIINIASIYGLLGQIGSLYEGTDMKNPAAYGASKAGLIQLTRWLATTLAPDIRVNAVSPGGIGRGQPESFVEKYKGRTPLGRMAHENDITGAVEFLAGEKATYVTGQNIVVDGGWCAW